jgi:hypothetical protein
VIVCTRVSSALIIIDTPPSALREHFQAKWTPVRVKKMLSFMKQTRLSDPSGSENASLAWLPSDSTMLASKAAFPQA